MKIDIIISLVLVLLVGGIVFLALNTPPDGPSSKTSQTQLALQTLPADLPEVFAPAPQGQGNAGELYEKLAAYYTANARQIEGRNPPQRMIDSLTQQVIAAADTPYEKQDFLDDQYPPEPGASPAFGGALETIPMLVLRDALDSKNNARIDRASRAVWIMGQRAFEKGNHLYIRRQGLNMMQFALSAKQQAIPADDADAKAAVAAWSSAISAIVSNWDSKMQIIWSVKQHKGDLLNIAQNDQDPTFRVAATAWLGVAKFNPGNRGNEKAIARLIESSKESDDADIARAAQAADAFTREDLRRMR